MSKVKDGDTIKIHYRGTLDNGSEFGSSAEREPFTFVVGRGQTIRGLDSAVVGMAPGERRTVRVPSADAYGPRREELVGRVERSKLPAHVTPKEGVHLQMMQSNGIPAVLIITAVSENTVTLDGNHPLAGLDLTYEIDLLEIA